MTMTPNKKDASSARSQLYEIALKVRGLGYLLENQIADGNLPMNPDDVMRGIGLIFQDLGEQTEKIWRLWDELDVQSD